MSQKRQQEEYANPQTEGSSSDDKRRKIPSLRNVVLEVMKFRTLQQFFEPVLEPLIRKVVKEEVDLALRKHLTSMKWNSGKEILPSDSRSLQLQFLDAISLPVFTGSRIEGEECTTMKVALIDALSGKVVSSGPISSAKVEILVLEGDFDGNERDFWTHEEFKSNLVREREGKKSLLTGDTFLNLKEGTGMLGEISFTDNSSWTRSRKFRLGARVVDNCDGVRIREAKTESFIVRDHRGELYKKHHPPSLYDEVWRLEKIGKEGAFHKRLSREKVNTVKDFLTLLFLDPARLRYILGTGMSAKMWEVTVEHARTCVIDKRVYLYYSTSQEKTGVGFNVVGQVMGLVSQGQYVSADKLSETEKADAHNLVILAFKQWEKVVSFDDEMSLVNGSPFLSNALYPCDTPMARSSSVDSFDFPQFSASTPDILPSIYSLMGCGNGSMDDFGINSIESIDVQFDQTLSFPDQAANSMICDADSITQTLCENEHIQYFDNDCSIPNPSLLGSQADLHSAVNGFLYARSAGTVAIVKAHRRWTILFSVFRWFSIRRIVARKSMLEKQRYILNEPCQNK